MNYRYGFVLRAANDYVRSVDLSYMDFIDEDQKRLLKIQFDNKNRLFIEEDVNATRTDQFVRLLEENGIEVGIISAVKWKPFPDKPKLIE